MGIFDTKKGMTMIELIVSLAILGIIAVTFLSIFVSMFRGIMNAGHRGKAAFSAQQSIENSIATNIKDGTATLKITYNGTTEVTIQGKNQSGTATSGTSSVTVRVFIPNY